jgi:hypothetical protein
MRFPSLWNVCADIIQLLPLMLAEVTFLHERATVYGWYGQHKLFCQVYLTSQAHTKQSICHGGK